MRLGTLLPDFNSTKPVSRELRPRRDETYPKIVRGSGAFYSYYQCNACAEYVDSNRDAGRWNADKENSTVLCTPCWSQGATSALAVTSNTGPLASKAPNNYAHATLEALPRYLRGFLKAWPAKAPFVLIAGVTGSGKTYLTWAVEKQLCLLRLPCRVEDGLELRSHWSGMLHERRGWYMAGLAETRYLILDALTDGEATEGWTQVVQDLLNKRFANARPTLITTMHDSAAIGTAWGNAILSRLKQYKWGKLPNYDRREKEDAKAAAGGGA